MSQSKNPNSLLSGGCYCGALKFQIETPTDFYSFCHCEDCRRSHGSPFVGWTSVPRDCFHWTTDTPSFREYESHPGVRWGFCGVCGTSFLQETAESPNQIYITTSSLNSVDRAPEAHVSFEEETLDWEQLHRLPKFVGKTDQEFKK